MVDRLEIKILEIKVFVIHCLQRIKILPMKWYKSELQLATLKGKKIKRFFDECEKQWEKEDAAESGGN